MTTYTPDDRRHGVATNAPDWYDVIWQTVIGCRAVSAGCDHCTALTIAARTPHPMYAGLTETTDGVARWTGRVRLDASVDTSLWPTSSRVFVAPMGDLFGEAVPDEHCQRVLEAVRARPEHTFLLLTKRPGRAVALIGELPPNALLGVTAENQRAAEERLAVFEGITWPRLWVNYEPALGPLDLGRWLHLLHWVSAGPEFGEGARSPDPAWFAALRDDCAWAGVYFYLKGVLDGHRHLDTPR